VADFILYADELKKKHQIRLKSFGHAGDGNLHIYILRDELGSEEWEEKLTAVFRDLYEQASLFGGKVSGEHGIGLAKRSYLKDSLGEVGMELLGNIKKAFDPKGILNPGKVV
jgi:glycolate oxidase